MFMRKYKVGILVAMKNKVGRLPEGRYVRIKSSQKIGGIVHYVVTDGVSSANVTNKDIKKF